MGMSGMILDNVEQFWNICHETIGQCATAEEWEAVMTPHLHLLQGSEDLSGTAKSIAKQNDVDIDLLKKLKKQKKLSFFIDDCMLHIDVPGKVVSQIWSDDFFNNMAPDDFDSHAFLEHSWTIFELKDKNLPVFKRDQVANG